MYVCSTVVPGEWWLLNHATKCKCFMHIYCEYTISKGISCRSPPDTPIPTSHLTPHTSPPDILVDPYDKNFKSIFSIEQINKCDRDHSKLFSTPSFIYWAVYYLVNSSRNFLGSIRIIVWFLFSTDRDYSRCNVVTTRLETSYIVLDLNAPVTNPMFEWCFFTNNLCIQKRICSNSNIFSYGN